MPHETISLTGDIIFKLRFNTMHGDTDFYWRVICTLFEGERESERERNGERIQENKSGERETEYLARAVRCKVETWSDASYDTRARAVKYNMAGRCSSLTIDEGGCATLM